MFQHNKDIRPVNTEVLKSQSENKMMYERRAIILVETSPGKYYLVEYLLRLGLNNSNYLPDLFNAIVSYLWYMKLPYVVVRKIQKK